MESANRSLCLLFAQESIPLGPYEWESELWSRLSYRLERMDAARVAADYFGHFTDCEPCRTTYLNRQITYYRQFSQLPPVAQDLLAPIPLYSDSELEIEEPVVQQKRLRESEESSSYEPDDEAKKVKKRASALRYYILPNKWCGLFSSIMAGIAPGAYAKRRKLFEKIIKELEIDEAEKPTIDTTAKHFDVCLNCARQSFVCRLTPEQIAENASLHKTIHAALTALDDKIPRTSAIRRIIDSSELTLTDVAIREHLSLCDQGCNQIWRDRYEKLAK